jgi:hypothetical protein
MWFQFMADFTISSGDYLRPYRSPWGSHPIRSLPESLSQTYRYGDVLERVAEGSTNAGRLALASTSGSTVTSTAIVGVAAEGASSVTAAKRIVYAANPNVEFWGRTRGATLASSNVDKAYGLFRDSSKNVFLVDLGNAASTSERVIITELIDAEGDSGGAVAFKFGTYNSTLVVFKGQGA